jgi:hypothetical protein
MTEPNYSLVYDDDTGEEECALKHIDKALAKLEKENE